MNIIFEIIISVVIAVICWFVLVWLAGLMAMPAVLVQLIGGLIFLYTAYRIVMLIKANPPRP